jgi:hypothetical protein
MGGVMAASGVRTDSDVARNDLLRAKEDFPDSTITEQSVR